MGTPPGVCPMAFWVMLQSIMGYGYPPPHLGVILTNKVKLLPFRRTTYAGGNETNATTTYFLLFFRETFHSTEIPNLQSTVSINHVKNRFLNLDFFHLFESCFTNDT